MKFCCNHLGFQTRKKFSVIMLFFWTKYEVFVKALIFRVGNFCLRFLGIRDSIGRAQNEHVRACKIDALKYVNKP